jgi:hypothetical protein
MTLQPIPSEFLIYEENFLFFFISVAGWFTSEEKNEKHVKMSQF